MKKLDENVVYTTENVSKERVKELHQWLLFNDRGWDNYNIKEITNVELEYERVGEHWCIYNLRGGATTSIDTLFEEPSSNIVLVSNDLVDWSVEEFVIEYNGNYYCDIGGNLGSFSYMLDLTENQKEYLIK